MDFTRVLLEWYRKNSRDLPWRRTRDPYLVWLSEIILQQTRIDQGLPYYERFVTAFPDITTLASAGEEQVLKLWQGLGYYSRARNLLETAVRIQRDYCGKFPSEYKKIRELKGIGDYTAAAIASIAFGLPYPVVDGNVLRFYSRYYGIEESIDSGKVKNLVTHLAEAHISHDAPGDFNQAIMEFGAIVCRPSNPSCEDCVVRSGCKALAENLVSKIPARTVKTPAKQRYINYFVIVCDGIPGKMVFLNKRAEDDIWKGLFDFPFFETDDWTDPGEVLEISELARQLLRQNGRFESVSGMYTHILTHQRLHARFFRFACDGEIDLDFLMVPLSKVHEYPVPRLIDRYLSDAELL